MMRFKRELRPLRREVTPRRLAAGIKAKERRLQKKIEAAPLFAPIYRRESAKTTPEQDIEA